VEFTFGGSDGLYKKNILLQEDELRGFDEVTRKADVSLTCIKKNIAEQHNPYRD
jgi:hypothetical protein